MKKYLIPTNFSPESKQTIEYVLGLLRTVKYPTQILLVTTYLIPTDVDPAQIISLNDNLRAEAREGLLRQSQWARGINANPKVTIETACHLGTLESVLLQYLKRKMVDFVAINKNGEFKLENLEAVLSKYQCPLLITA